MFNEKECAKKWRKEHREEYNAIQRKYYHAHKKELAPLKKKYQEEHREQYRLYRQKNYQKNKERLHKIKLNYVHQLGSKCSNCGYNNNWSALEFHHPNGRYFPRYKDDLSENPLSTKFDIKKVKLLCVNCHRETHHPQCILG